MSGENLPFNEQYNGQQIKLHSEKVAENIKVEERQVAG